MNQRIISSSPSILFSKGVTLKVGDWRLDGQATGTEQPTASNPTLQRRSLSNQMMTRSQSCSTFRKLSSFSSSSSSSLKQFDLHRLSSSSLASSVPKKRTSAMGNAVWDNASVAKQNVRLNLVALKLDDPEIRLGRSCIPDMFLDGIHDKAPRNGSRSSISSLLSLREEEEETSKYHKNATWNDEEFTTGNTLNNNDNSSHDVRKDKTFLVKTFAEKVPKHIDIRCMISSDLDYIKADDAFMYYSIPGVKEAVWRGNSVDLKDAKHSTPIVTRCSAISFEPADIFEPADMMADEDDLDIPSLYEGFYSTNSDIDDSHEDELSISFL